MPSLDNNDTEVSQGSVTQGTRPGLTESTILATATNSTLYHHDGSYKGQVLSAGTRIDKGVKCWHITTRVSEEDAVRLRDKYILQTVELGSDAPDAAEPEGELKEFCLWADNVLSE